MTSKTELTFQSLAYINLDTLLKCFNASFKKYFIPFQFTQEQLAGKLYAGAVDMRLSFGAFDNNSLVAFILNGIDILDNKKIAYNAGTGVLPGYRGNNLSYSLYEYCISHFKNHGIEKCILDVFVQNKAAIKTYERIGFTAKRKLLNYAGKVDCKKTAFIHIKTTVHPDWNMVDELCEWQRSWFYNNNSLKRGWKNYSILIAGSDNIDKAYCIVDFKTGRIANFGSKDNNLEYLSSIFAHLRKNIKPALTIINLDEMAVNLMNSLHQSEWNNLSLLMKWKCLSSRSF